jgi:hypothetical protein
MKNPSHAKAIEYLKEHNYIFKGIFSEKIYNLVICIHLCMVYSIFSFTTEFIKFTLIGYILSNIVFLTGHTVTHSIFIETNIIDFFDKVENLKGFGPGICAAYIHHYCYSRGLSDYWLEHRLGYIYDGWVLIYLPWIPFILQYRTLYPYFVMFSSIWMLQGPIHEWIHLNNRERKVHFNFILNTLILLFSKVGIVNVKKHLKHHIHKESNLEQVKDFDDMRFPGFGEFIDMLWVYLVSFKKRKEIPNEKQFLYKTTLAIHYTSIISAIYLTYIFSTCGTY